jgi:hypothetical protein
MSFKLRSVTPTGIPHGHMQVTRTLFSPHGQKRSCIDSHSPNIPIFACPLQGWSLPEGLGRQDRTRKFEGKECFEVPSPLVAVGVQGRCGRTENNGIRGKERLTGTFWMHVIGAEPHR